MTESDPGFSEAHAGDVGARRATVGMPTDHESINVPPTREGAVENAEAAAEARRPHEEFVPEGPIPDDRAMAEASASAHDSETPLGKRVAGWPGEGNASGNPGTPVGAAVNETSVRGAQAGHRPKLLIAAAGAVALLIARRLMKRGRK
ncbi:hypothetical protein ACFXJ8_13210 [Nonomuraea sp. NPDC059194]|uniref:hypothetical protein n=1 Tax=Nonomuraea sp. NPDC059194 TaxID=3346764 RepID=UPI0036C14226